MERLLEARVRSMFVRRFVHWLAGLRASAYTPSLASPQREGVVIAVVPLHVTSWLAASRRLRPSRDVTLTTVSSARDRQVPPRLRSGGLGREQVVAGRSRPLDLQPGARPPLRGDSAAQQQSAQAGPLSEPHAPRPDDPTLEPSSPFGDDIALHRQLAAFKQLVRLGVYNEGFRQDALPEQYARSRYPDDDLPFGTPEISN